MQFFKEYMSKQLATWCVINTRKASNRYAVLRNTVKRVVIKRRVA